MNKITAEEAKEALELLKRYGNEQTDVMDLYRSIGSFINQQIQANEPLTEEEKKVLKENGLTFIIDTSNIREFDSAVIGFLWSEQDDDAILFGVGHTKDQAERDAYRQLEERGLI